MLIVAEKYQTGFDEPLLHTMFVDKKLSGVKAVQTLSRLNRTARGKQDTFVLDFVNSAEDIKKSFEPYYEETVLTEETDPNVIYDIKNTLDQYQVYREVEVEQFAEIFYSNNQKSNDMGRLQSKITPALQRYNDLNQEKRDLFKSTLARFNRINAFVTQVTRMFDKDIHKFSIYAKFLLTQLPKNGVEPVDLDDKILLEYYKLEKDFEGSINLEGSAEGFTPIKGEAGRKEIKKDPLTVLIDKINTIFGTQCTEMDKVLMQIENDYASEEQWQSYAANNDKKTFMLLFERDFPEKAAARYEQNDQFFVKMFNEPSFMQKVIEDLGGLIYERLKKTFKYSMESNVNQYMVAEDEKKYNIDDILVEKCRKEGKI